MNFRFLSLLPAVFVFALAAALSSPASAQTVINAPSGKVGAAYATIEQALNPTNPDKTILVLHAPSASALRDLAADLQDFGRLVRMEGKAAVFGGDNSVESIKIDEKSRRQVGVIPLSSSFQTFVRASWPLLVLGVILASVVLSVLVRAWADRRGGQA